eukprot:12779-Heterococcus_DN1.PRE.1
MAHSADNVAALLLLDRDQQFLREQSAYILTHTSMYRCIYMRHHCYYTHTQCHQPPHPQRRQALCAQQGTQVREGPWSPCIKRFRCLNNSSSCSRKNGYDCAAPTTLYLLLYNKNKSCCLLVLQLALSLCRCVSADILRIAAAAAATQAACMHALLSLRCCERSMKCFQL